MPAMLVVSNIGCGILALFSVAVILITRGIGQGGDGPMAIVTLIVLGFGGALSALVVGVIAGALVSRINHFNLLDNMRSIGIDICLLFIVFLVGQAAFVNTISQYEQSAKKASDGEIKDRIVVLRSQLPPQYQSMSPSGIITLSKQKSNWSIPKGVVDAAQEIQDLEAKQVNDYGLAQFNRNNERRSTMFWTSIAGWLVSIVAVPVWLKRKSVTIEAN
jgi:hypothetical protein